MPELNFQIEGVEVPAFTAAPQLTFKLGLTNAPASERVHTVALRCQIQIEVTRRHYTRDEQKKLLDLFGEPDRWGQTLRSLLWTHVSIVVPGFQAKTVVDMPVPCTFDFNVAATKYFYGLTEGDVPINVMFSGTVFYENADGTLQVAPISWDKEARFKLPINIWRDMMETYYPNSAWLSLRRDVFERLYQYKMRQGIPTWEEALENVLPVEEAINS
jgi:hypothetical protein